MPISENYISVHSEKIDLLQEVSRPKSVTEIQPSFD